MTRFARIALLVLLPLGAACSGDGEGGGAEDPEPRVVGTAPVQALGSRNVVALLLEGEPVPPAPSDTLLMDQLGLAFFPSVLIARPGQTVEFRNSEVTDHNVQVRSLENDSTLFNQGSTRGFPYYHTFHAEGGYALSCDIHSGMSATIVVVPTPWAVRVEEDGSFALGDVPAGSYRAVLWSRDPALRTERPVVVPDTGAVTVDLR